MTPVVAAIVGAVIQFLLNDVVKAVRQESATIIAKKIKAIFQPSAETKDGALKLTQTHLAKAEEIIRTEAIRRGMAPKAAEELALLVVGRMALAK
jgi:hypothetical protein